MYIPLKKVTPAAGGNEEADRRHKLDPSCRPIALLLSVTSSSTTAAAVTAPAAPATLATTPAAA